MCYVATDRAITIKSTVTYNLYLIPVTILCVCIHRVELTNDYVDNTVGRCGGTGQQARLDTFQYRGGID